MYNINVLLYQSIQSFREKCHLLFPGIIDHTVTSDPFKKGTFIK